MKQLASLYYLFYILSGGFRHYSYEYLFFVTNSSEEVSRLVETIHFTEYLLLILTLLLFVFPLQKILTAVFIGLTFSLDFYFQNWIRFESSFILVHSIPLFFFLHMLIKTEGNKNLLRKAATLFIAVGYVSSGFAKAFSGWWSPENLVIKEYFFQFNETLQVPILFSNYISELGSDTVWKLLDYLVLAFEFSFLLLFLTNTKKSKTVLFSLAVVFHLIVFCFLGISQFFMHPLAYLLCHKIRVYPINQQLLYYTKGAILLALFFLFIQNDFIIQFFQNSLSLSQYLYYELSLLVLTSSIWFAFLFKGFNFGGNENK